MLSKIAVQLAHVGHLGTEKTKRLLRSKFYFPELDKLAEELFQCCFPCQSVTKPKTKPTLQSQPLQKKRLAESSY